MHYSHSIAKRTIEIALSQDAIEKATCLLLTNTTMAQRQQNPPPTMPLRCPPRLLRPPQLHPPAVVGHNHIRRSQLLQRYVCVNAGKSHLLFLLVKTVKTVIIAIASFL